MDRLSLRLSAICWLASCWSMAADDLPSAMDHDPGFEPQTVLHAAPDGLVPLWLDLLNQDEVESEVVCQAARGLVRFHRLGMSLESRAVEQFAQLLGRPTLDRAARLAVARALVELDAKQHAALLAAQLSSGGRDMAEIVEPALARWGDQSLREEWLARLDDPNVSRRALHLAVQAAGTLDEPAAQASLLEIIADPSKPLAIRYDAAKSLSRMSDSGLEEDARRLLAADDASQPGVRLLAARMLARHSGRATEELLLQLSEDDEPAVAAAAVERLLQINAVLLEPLQSRMLKSPDARLRLLGIQVVRSLSDAEGISQLGELLDDRHLDVRHAARNALIEFASVAARREDVCREATDLLDADFPRRTEQALQVLAALDFEPAAPRMLELLEAREPSVSVTAAWALERVAAPGSGDKILAHLLNEIKRTAEIVNELAPLYGPGKTPEVELPNLDAMYRQQEHLILALGQLRFAGADELLRKFIPKPVYTPGDPPPLEVNKRPRPRAAAIWALGKIHAGRAGAAPGELLEALEARLADTTPIPREEPIVRRMAAVSLGRIAAPQSLPSLREFFDPAAEFGDPGRACGWAIEQMTGEAPPRETTRTVRHVDWFLTPLAP